MKSIVVIVLLSVQSLFAQMYHHMVGKVSQDVYIWEQQAESPFEELIVSWNAKRPAQGSFSVYVKVNTGKWSPYLFYAKWGADYQKGVISKIEGQPVRVYQDAFEILNGAKGLSFRIKVVASDGAMLTDLKALHVCASKPRQFKVQREIIEGASSFALNVKGLSQMALDDERSKRLCSPTSTTAVVRYLNHEEELSPISFAERVWDASFDIFGNWVFNVAEAYNQLRDPTCFCWVERLGSFQDILESLSCGFPVVISVRGPLPGSALPYKGGHLLVVIGFDAESNEVICMDPAFDKDDRTRVAYKLDDLLAAWGRRKNVAYIFNKI